MWVVLMDYHHQLDVPHFLRRSSKLHERINGLHIDIFKFIGNFCLGLCSPFMSFHTQMLTERHVFSKKALEASPETSPLSVELFGVGCM